MNVSFKITVFAKNKRKDNTYPVNIRIGYKSKYANIDTGFYAGATEINKKGEVKNGFIVDMCDKKIDKYKDKIGIDCGATFKHLGGYLSCIRLDDLKEYYV